MNRKSYKALAILFGIVATIIAVYCFLKPDLVLWSKPFMYTLYGLYMVVLVFILIKPSKKHNK